MPAKKVRPKYRKEVNKPESESRIIDEWEITDIDRDEQKAGIKRREQRIKDEKLEALRANKLRQMAIDKAAKMDSKAVYRDPTPLERAWLQCDYILWNIMDIHAYEFMEYQRLNSPEIYKRLYRKFISPYMMERASQWVDYFALGGKIDKRVVLGTVIKEYKKILGIKSRIRIIHKGEKEKEISEIVHLDEE